MADKGKYVKSPLPADVLLGRGTGPNMHKGNILFRQLVAERKAEYGAEKLRKGKAKIAKEVVDQVVKANGRFMKKVEPSEQKRLGLSEGTGKDLWWEIADDDAALEKTKQALRQLEKKHKRKANDTSTDTSGDEPEKKKQRQTPTVMAKS